MRPDEKVFRTLVDEMTYGIFVVQRGGQITYWNRAAERLTGYRSDEVLGKQACRDVLKPVDAEGKSICDSGCPLEETLKEGEKQETALFLHHRDGERLPVVMSTAPIRDGNEEIIATVQVLRDNSVMVAAQERIEELETLSLVDPLTKLGNRLYLEMNILGKLHELRRYGWPFGVLFMDVDEFKGINDVHGHDVGDLVLVNIAKVLKAQSRPFDVVGRWGGDEFCSVVVHATPEQLAGIAGRYRAMVEDTRTQKSAEVIQATISIGATIARPEDSVDALYRRADQLMYESKAAGRNCVTMDPDKG